MKKQQLVVSFDSRKHGTFHAPEEPGRNAPCPCKSGKKYKHCCLAKFEAPVAAKVVDVSKRNEAYTAPTSAVSANTEEAAAPPVTKSSFMGMFQKAAALVRKGGAK